MDWFFSYSHQMVSEAKVVKDALYDALSNNGWGVNGQPPRAGGATHRLLDDGGLESGDFWPGQLLDWLHACEGGILFFAKDKEQAAGSWDDHMIQRRWLYIEPIMLISRKVRGQLARCVPIFVDTHRDDHPVARFIHRDWPGLQEMRLSVPLVPSELGPLIAALRGRPGRLAAIGAAEDGEGDPFEAFVVGFVSIIAKSAKKRAVKIALLGNDDPAQVGSATIEQRLNQRLDKIRGDRGINDLSDKRCLDLAVAEIVISGPMWGDQRSNLRYCALNHLTILRILADSFEVITKKDHDYGERALRGWAEYRTKWVSPVAMRGFSTALRCGAHTFIFDNEAMFDSERVKRAVPVETLAVLEELVEAGKFLGAADIGTTLNEFADRIGNYCKKPSAADRAQRLASLVYQIAPEEKDLSRVIRDVGEILDTRRADPVDPILVVDSRGFLLTIEKDASAAPRRGKGVREAAVRPRTRLDVLLEKSRPRFAYKGEVGPAGRPYNPLFVFCFASDIPRDRLAELNDVDTHVVPIDLDWRSAVMNVINREPL